MQTVDSHTVDQLFASYVQGDVSAFAGLYARLSPKMIAIVRSIVHDPGLAEEITQESFQSIHQNRHQYRIGTNLQAWIAQICRNKAFAHFRQKVMQDQTISGLQQLQRYKPPHEKLHSRELNEAVEHVIERLSPSHQRIIRWHFFEGLTPQEIAGKLHTTGPTTRYHMATSVRKFKEEWAKFNS